MSHLHLPDGLLPAWLWLPALALVVGLLALSGRTLSPRRVAYQGALGAMMLAAMSVPLGPLDYHLALAGPVGVLLGPAAAFQVVFVVTAILAFLGHGGFTSIGLNTLLLAGAATGAHLAFRLTLRRLSTPWALAIATATGQTASGLLWFAIVGLALRTARMEATRASDARLGVITAVVIALWLVGVLVESVVAWGIGRFLARVRPGLLPSDTTRAEEVAWST
jgi:cobalt/nickel transport system permease protein